MRRADLDNKIPGNAKRRKTLLSAVGLWKDRTDLPDTHTYVRSLRKGDRIKRLASK